jgi:hypothetical protein
MVQNEIRYLRDLYLCENVISLESVHLDTDTKEYNLVLKFAEYGCLRTFLIKKGNERLKES